MAFKIKYVFNPEICLYIYLNMFLSFFGENNNNNKTPLQ